MTTESDRLLIQQIRTASGPAYQAAWQELFERYSGRVRAYIRRDARVPLRGNVPDNATQTVRAKQFRFRRPSRCRRRR